jgi:hypothetical protein
MTEQSRRFNARCSAADVVETREVRLEAAER